MLTCISQEKMTQHEKKKEKSKSLNVMRKNNGRTISK